MPHSRMIGYRSLVLAGGAAAEAGSSRRLGLYGFGAAAHIVAQVARHLGHEIYAFTKPGDTDAQRFALDLGAKWAGDSTDRPPAPLDAAIIFAAVGSLVPAALRALVKGGTVVCASIHMTDIPSFPYEILWGERVVR
jgi:propanol-preferring alcohol dehydrogenase